MHGLLSITVPLKVLINHNIDFGFHPKEIGVILKDFSPRIFMITFGFSKDYLVSSGEVLTCHRDRMLLPQKVSPYFALISWPLPHC